MIMFAKYKNNIYSYRRNSRLVTEQTEKAGSDFVSKTSYSYSYFYKDVALDAPELTDVYDIDLWVEYDCGFPKVSKEWVIYLDGHCKTLKDDFMVETSKNVPGWEQCDKDAVCGKIPFKDIELAWVDYKYIKKDGIVLEEPLFIREYVSVEKLIELRKFYGVEGKL